MLTRFLQVEIFGKRMTLVLAHLHSKSLISPFYRTWVQIIQICAPRLNLSAWIHLKKGFVRWHSWCNGNFELFYLQVPHSYVINIYHDIRYSQTNALALFLGYRFPIFNFVCSCKKLVGIYMRHVECNLNLHLYIISYLTACILKMAAYYSFYNNI